MHPTVIYNNETWYVTAYNDTHTRIVRNGVVKWVPIEETN